VNYTAPAEGLKSWEDVGSSAFASKVLIRHREGLLSIDEKKPPYELLGDSVKANGNVLRVSGGGSGSCCCKETIVVDADVMPPVRERFHRSHLFPPYALLLLV